MKKTMLMVWLALLLVASCKKKDPSPELPPETQHGANTFGCYLNGKPWQPSANGIGSRNLYVQLDGYTFTLYANYDEGERDERISFFSGSIKKTGQYPIGKLALNGGSVCDFWDIGKNKPIINSADSDVVSDGLLTITKFDTNKKIVAGNFWFKLQKNDGTVIEAKDGRFDISF